MSSGPPDDERVGAPLDGCCHWLVGAGSGVAAALPGGGFKSASPAFIDQDSYQKKVLAKVFL